MLFRSRLPIPLLTRWLGRRRSWLLLSQLAIIGGLVGMAFTDPKIDLMPIALKALILIVKLRWLQPIKLAIVSR